MSENDRVSDREFQIMVGARRLLSRPWRHKPNWVIAMEIFCLGSTYAKALCVRNDIDPDANKIAPVRLAGATLSPEPHQ